MRTRKLAYAAIILALAGSSHAVARDGSHSRGHVRHAGAKPANHSVRSSPAVRPAVSDQRHPEDVALDRKIKSICRGC
jgi:hypothetical protein